VAVPHVGDDEAARCEERTMTREPTIPEQIAPRTGDFALVQALSETRTLARRRRDEDDESSDHRWGSLADRADRVLAALGVERSEAGHTPAIGFDRLDRTAIEIAPEDADRIAASLRALQDRPDTDRIDAAERSLADLEDALG
jgi:hypothetical protein